MASRPSSLTPSPWPRRRPGDPVTVLAHRGGSGPWRENTLEAFAASLRAGADGVELDVRRGADGALIVHHDAEIPGSGLVHELRSDERPDWVPTLETALATCAGAVVNVEIKNLPTDPGYDPADQVALDVAAVLVRGAGAAAPWPAHVVVSSFWPDTLAAVGTAYRRAEDGARPRRPGHDPAPLGLFGAPRPRRPRRARHGAEPRLWGAAPPSLPGERPARGPRPMPSGLAVVTWTVNSPDDLDAVVEAGVDVVITDSVADTLAHLGRT